MLLLPYIDLVLLASNVAINLIVSTILSVVFLKERLIWKYDAPAFILIVAGAASIVLLSEQPEGTPTHQQVRDLLFSVQSIICYLLAVVVLTVSLLSYTLLIKKMKDFE